MFMLHGNGWTCGRGRCWWTFWCPSRCYQLLGAEHPLIRRQCVSNGRRRHESRWRNGPVPLAATVPRREQDRDDPRAHCDSDEHHPGQTPPVTGGDGDRAGDDHPKAGARADRRPGEVTAPWVRAPRDEFGVGGERQACRNGHQYTHCPARVCWEGPRSPSSRRPPAPQRDR